VRVTARLFLHLGTRLSYDTRARSTNSEKRIVVANVVWKNEKFDHGTIPYAMGSEASRQRLMQVQFDFWNNGAINQWGNKFNKMGQ
jgi:hypothetical protein